MNRTPVALVGWELGAGRGHLELALPLIEALLGRGWKVIAGMRDITAAQTVFARLDPATSGSFELRQAPIFLHLAVPPSRPLFSLAEALAHSGFADPATWRPVVAAWGRMIDDVRPDMILADSAPSLALAASGRVPIVMTGNGWTIPPDMDMIPPLALVGYDPRRAAAAEHAICQAANILRQGSNRRWFIDLLRGDENFIFGHPLLDPYRVYRTEPVWWPPNLKVTPAQPTTTKALVAYLPRNHPAQSNLLAALNLLSSKSVIYFGGNEVARGNNVQVSAVPLELSHMLPATTCAVHHGGLGMTSWCLVYGVPQVLMPTDLEKHLYGLAIVDAKCGSVIAPTATPTAISETIKYAQGLLPYSGFMGGTAQETIDTIVHVCSKYIC